MTDEMMKYFKVIGEIQNEIRKTDSFDEAIKTGVQKILQAFPSEYAIIWYKEGEYLHPYYWRGSKDFTSYIHKVGEGIVGRVYETQKAERLLEYKRGINPETDKDFEDIEITSMICVPFSNQYENLGCMQFARTAESENFNDEIADVCEILANLIAIQIDQIETMNPKWNFDKVILSARDIKRSFVNGDMVTTVLRGVNIDVYEGELLVILGESGSGKSTFLNIIGGMDSADSGSIRFMGNELSNATQEELTTYRRENIGFIFQGYNLISTLTASQNIDLIGELVSEHLSSDEVLDMVGLLDKKNNYPSQLSGGQ